MLEKGGAPQISKVSSMLLAKISQVLDRPVSDFFETEPRDLGHTTELLRLWLTINDEQDRMKVLSFIRSIEGRNMRE